MYHMIHCIFPSGGEERLDVFRHVVSVPNNTKTALLLSVPVSVRCLTTHTVVVLRSIVCFAYIQVARSGWMCFVMLCQCPTHPRQH